MKKSVGSMSLKYFFVIVLMIVFLVPLFFIVNTALKTESGFLRDTVGLTTTFRLQNFTDAWSKAKFGLYTLNSVFYVIIAVSISIVMALFLAFPLARRFFKSTNFIYTAFIAGMFLPSGIIPLWQMLLRGHLYNTRTGYILTLVGGGGVTLFFFVAYIRNIPRDFDEAAAIDGCGYVRYVLTILLPLMKPAVASMVILMSIGVWNEILNAIIFMSDAKFYPITRGLYVFKGQYSVQWTLLTAALLIVAAPLVLLFIFLQRYIIDGLVAGGIKA